MASKGHTFVTTPFGHARAVTTEALGFLSSRSLMGAFKVPKILPPNAFHFQLVRQAYSPLVN